MRCCVRRRTAILIRYTLKTPLVPYWWSHKDSISMNSHLLISLFLSTDQTVQADYPFSSCFHFSKQLPIFSTSLKDKVPFYFKMRDNFLFFGQKGERIRTCTSTELTFLFFFKASDGSCAFTVHHQVLTLDVVPVKLGGCLND